MYLLAAVRTRSLLPHEILLNLHRFASELGAAARALFVFLVDESSTLGTQEYFRLLCQDLLEVLVLKLFRPPIAEVVELLGLLRVDVKPLHQGRNGVSCLPRYGCPAVPALRCLGLEGFPAQGAGQFAACASVQLGSPFEKGLLHPETNTYIDLRLTLPLSECLTKEG